jgi:hypothetical protein
MAKPSQDRALRRVGRFSAVTDGIFNRAICGSKEPAFTTRLSPMRRPLRPGSWGKDTGDGEGNRRQRSDRLRASDCFAPGILFAPVPYVRPRVPRGPSASLARQFCTAWRSDRKRFADVTADSDGACVQSGHRTKHRSSHMWFIGAGSASRCRSGFQKPARWPTAPGSPVGTGRW